MHRGAGNGYRSSCAAGLKKKRRWVMIRKAKLPLLFAAAVLLAGLSSSAWAVNIALPIKEVRTLINVSSVDEAVKLGHAKVINKINAKTDAGKWAIGQAKKLNVKMSGKTVEYDIDAIESTQDIAGVDFPVWGFVPKGKKLSYGSQGPVPGPTVIADEGDLVRINFRNLSKNNHTIHIHGPTVIRYDADGTMNVAQVPVKIDHEFIYEFVASPVGTHIYHCHVNANEHMDMGLYGAIVIHSKSDEKVDQDLLVMLDEWDSTFSKEQGFSPTTSDQKMSVEVGHPRKIGNMNLFTLNGNAWTDEYPNVVLAQSGQKIRVRFINFGSTTHNMHLHGHTLHWVTWDGRNVFPYDGKISDKDMRSDSASLVPGERKDYIFVADQEGRWVWHCHVVPHATNDGVYHGGLLMAVVYLGKDDKGGLYPKGIDLDAYPLGMPTKISAAELEKAKKK